MTCQEAAGLLFDVVAGEIPGEQQGAFDGHLACCPACAALAGTYQWTIFLARRMPPRELPAALQARLLEAIANQPSPCAEE